MKVKALSKSSKARSRRREFLLLRDPLAFRTGDPASSEMDKRKEKKVGENVDPKVPRFLC